MKLEGKMVQLVEHLTDPNAWVEGKLAMASTNEILKNELEGWKLVHETGWQKTGANNYQNQLEFEREVE